MPIRRAKTMPRDARPRQPRSREAEPTWQPPSRGTWLRRFGPEGEESRARLGTLLAPHELAALGSYYWQGWARDEQLPPEDAWRTWLICAGRGFGKTRAGAEWVRDAARHDGAARIALVGASLTEVRNVMVEGDSGVLAAAPGALTQVSGSSKVKPSSSNIDTRGTLRRWSRNRLVMSARRVIICLATGQNIATDPIALHSICAPHRN